MTTPTTSGWFTGRTKLITIASIAAVAVAGALAVSANLGILNAAAETDVGTLNAVGVATTPSPQIVYVDDPALSTTVASASPSGQEFAVDVAGTVSVTGDANGAHLDRVAPNPGWTWALTQVTSDQLSVRFTDGTRAFDFLATVGPDGSIAAGVTEPIVTAAEPQPAPRDADEDHDDEYEGGEDDD